MGRYDQRIPCPYGYPAGCNCETCVGDRKGNARVGRSQNRSHSSGIGGRFEGKEIKVITGAKGRPGRFEFYYGGAMYADGPGHGHVVCNDGETINFWRKPTSEGGQTVVDDNWSTERLSAHMF